MPLSTIQIGRRIYRMLSPDRIQLGRGERGLDLRVGVEDTPGTLLTARNADLRGGRLRARPGYRSVSGLPAAKQFTYMYYSKQFDYLYLVEEKVGGKIYRTNDLSLSGTFTDVTGTLTMTSIGMQMVDFNGALVAITGNGVWASTNGTTWTLQTGAVTGNAIVSWQNKLWAARLYTGDFGAITTYTRVFRSNIGSYATWTTATDFTDIREGEQGEAPLTAMHVTQADDSTGRASFLIAKHRALHRVNDPSTGSFTTLSENVGCVARRGIASGNGMTVFLSDRGVYATTGDTRPVEIGSQVRPLFQNNPAPALTNLLTYVVFAAGRFMFSMAGWDPISAAYSLNSVVQLEYDPETKTWCNHTFAGHFAHTSWAMVELPASSLSSATDNSRPRIYSIDPNTTTGMYRMFDDIGGGATNDAGTANTLVVQTPYIRPTGGTRCNLLRLRLSVLNGAGSTVTVRVRKDGSSTDSLTRTATPSAGVLQDLDFWQLGNCRSVSFVIEQALAGGTFPSNYRPDAHLEDRFEIVSMMLEFVPTGEK